MSNKEILEKVIKQAIRNNYKLELPLYVYDIKEDYLIGESNPPEVVPYKYLTQIIFSHEFAQAFFGEGHDVYMGENHPKTLIRYYFHDSEGNDVYSHLKRWQYCLREMTLEEKYLKYLGKFLEKDNGSDKTSYNIFSK